MSSRAFPSKHFHFFPLSSACHAETQVGAGLVHYSKHDQCYYCLSTSPGADEQPLLDHAAKPYI